MAKFEVKFNAAGAQADLFRKAESDLRTYINAVRTAALNLNTRDNSLLGRPQADILVQLRKLESVCEKLTAEGQALPQIMEIYSKAERNTFSFIGDNVLVKGALSFVAGFWNLVSGWTGAVVGWITSLLTIISPKPVAPAAMPVKTPGTTPLGKLVNEASSAPVDEFADDTKNNRQPAPAANANTPNGNLPSNNPAVKRVGANAMINDGVGNAFDSITVNGVTVSAYADRQCSELVSRFYKEAYGLEVGNLFAANPSNQPTGGVIATNSPKAGDIVRFGAYTAGSLGDGHWALVKSVNADGTITIIEQNYAYAGKYYVNRTIRIDEATAYYTAP